MWGTGNSTLQRANLKGSRRKGDKTWKPPESIWEGGALSKVQKTLRNATAVARRTQHRGKRVLGGDRVKVAIANAGRLRKYGGGLGRVSY